LGVKITTDRFIEKAITVHGDVYNYSLVEYKHHATKVRIVCFDHGEFEQTPNSHLNGRGCPTCGRISSNKNRMVKTCDLVKRFAVIHKGKYEYLSMVYRGMFKNITIGCPIHGNFEQLALNHSKGEGCPKCKYGGLDILKPKGIDRFIHDAVIAHGDKYNYSQVDYKQCKIKVKIFCNKCNSYFFQTPDNHLNGGSGCPKCIRPKGSSIIERYLEDRHLNYKPEHRFPNCVNIRPLPFDFYLPNKSICIEYDGIQHFKPVNFTGKLSEDEVMSEFENGKIRDNIKNKYCKDNNIKLIRISYLNIDNIPQILDKELF
jgi:hypothetical protein